MGNRVVKSSGHLKIVKRVKDNKGVYYTPRTGLSKVLDWFKKRY